MVVESLESDEKAKAGYYMGDPNDSRASQHQRQSLVVSDDAILSSARTALLMCTLPTPPKRKATTFVELSVDQIGAQGLGTLFKRLLKH